MIRMSRYFDLSSNHVLFVGESAGELDRSLMLPVEAFTNSGITEEMTLVSQIFDCAKTIAQLKLSEVALSLYSAYILLQAGRNSIKIFHKLFSRNEKTSFESSLETQHCTVLIPERPGLRNLDEIRKLNTAVANSLEKEINKSQAGSVGNIKEEAGTSAMNVLSSKRHTLRLQLSSFKKVLIFKLQGTQFPPLGSVIKI